jgi:hypothetical protein
MKILGAALGNCVHVAGVLSFLDIARKLGNDTVFLGPAVPVKQLAKAIREHDPDIVALSYRLSPESAAAVFADLKAAVQEDPILARRKYFFGGTPPVVALARETGMFDVCFDGTEPEVAVAKALRPVSSDESSSRGSDDLISRIEESVPIPLIRHHFGLPSLEDTIEGARRIAQSGQVDILSLAPDQNAQEAFFRPDEMDTRMDGAGGVPVRKPEHLRAIYEATRTGNHPLLRCYSGTNDLEKWAEMLKETINIAWGAVPLMWYSELDGRSKRSLKDAITENQAAIWWYANHGIPVEVNESHQWAMRRSGDVVEIATGYLAAYNAKSLGVKNYVCQFMFDTPRGISPAMDLAKMLAKAELVESLRDDNFRVVRMVRSGLQSFSPSANVAKGQLASSVFSAMAMRPHIVHVVGFSEADHAARPADVIESCEIARGAIGKALLGTANPESDPAVLARKTELLSEVRFLLDAIKRLKRHSQTDPLTSPEMLARAVKEGLLDASDLVGGKAARGRIVTAVVNGACVSVDPSSGKPINERQRIRELGVSEADLDLAEL